MPLCPPSICVDDHKRRIAIVLIVLAAAFTAGLAKPTMTALAGTLIVTNTNDTGAGSLRAAVSSASSGDTIQFNLSGCPCVIALSGSLSINKNLTIEGPGPTRDQIVIQPISQYGSRLFDIGSVTVTFRLMTLQNGRDQLGGAVNNNGGTLTLDQMYFYNNRATATVGDAKGGAVYSVGGSLTIQNSKFEANTLGASVGNGYGGAVYSFDGPVTVSSSSVFINNGPGPNSTAVSLAAYGGAIASSTGAINVSNTTFTNNGNNLSGQGGAIYSVSGSITEQDSQFTNNGYTTEGGAISNTTGTITLVGGSFFGNSATNGGAISINNVLGGRLTIDNANFTSNSANYGAAIYYVGSGFDIKHAFFNGNLQKNTGDITVSKGISTIEGSVFKASVSTTGTSGASVINNSGTSVLTITNSSFGDANFTNSSNSATIYNAASLKSYNNTVAYNTVGAGTSSGGIQNDGLGTLTMGNTIVSYNRVGTMALDMRGSFSSSGNNLVTQRGTSSGYIGSDLANGTDPMLSPLTFHGGLVAEAMELNIGSPAIDAGSDALCNGGDVQAVDGRGTVRPVDGDGDLAAKCDIGAYERPLKPTITLSAPNTQVAIGTSATLTFNINNPSAGNIFVNSSLTAVLPSNLVVAQAPTVTNNCTNPGTVTANPGSSVISTERVAAYAGSSCVITVNVTSSKPDVYNVQTGPLSTSQMSSTASNTLGLKFFLRPTLGASFNTERIGVNGTATLTYSLGNPNTNPALMLTGVGFVNTLPLGMTSSVQPTNNCGSGSATYTGGVVTVSGVTLTATQQCTISLTVTAATDGIFTPLIQSITSNETNLTTISTSATLLVLKQPTVVLGFSPATIPVNGTARLSYTIGNTNTTSALAGIAFTQTLSNLAIQNPANVTNTCSDAGTVTATPGTNTVSVSGIMLSPSSNCQVSFDVKGSSIGNFPQTTGTVSSTYTGVGTTSNTAPLSVITNPLVITLSGPNSVKQVGDSLRLRYALNNTTAGVLTGVTFNHVLPVSVKVAQKPQASSNCSAPGLISASPGASSINLSDAGLNGTENCHIDVNVVASRPGLYSLATGAVSSTQGDVGLQSNNTLLNVMVTPSLGLSITPSTTAVGNIVRITVGLNNPNNVPVTGVNWSYTMDGMSIASVPNAITTCAQPGTLIAIGTSQTASVTGGALYADEVCAYAFDAIADGAVGNSYDNQTTQISTNEIGNGAKSNKVTFSVLRSPVVTMGFAPTTVKIGDVSTLTFTINNPNSPTKPLTNVQFINALPGNLTVAASPAIGGTCAGIGAAVQAPVGSNTLTVNGLTLSSATASCTITIPIVGSESGDYLNSLTAMRANETGPTVLSATAALTVARYSCDTAGVATALNAGGNSTFACTGPTTITLTSSATVNTNGALDGGGKLRIASAIPRPPGRARDGRIFGAIQVGSGVVLKITGITFENSSNPAAPPLGISGTAELTNVVFNNNTNSGALVAYSGATVTIRNSTFSNNTVAQDAEQSDGGAVYIEPGANVTIINSTFYGNSVTSRSFNQRGGAIFVADTGVATVYNSTFANNTANGAGKTIFVEGSGQITLANSIIASPVLGACSGNITDGGFNLQFPGVSCGAYIPLADPLLGPLAANGGYSQTMIPGVGSPAINTGSPTICADLEKTHAVDQRGYLRPPLGSGAGTYCDIGSVEVGGESPTLKLNAPTDVAVGVPFEVTLLALNGAGQSATGYTGRVHFTSSDPGAVLPVDYNFEGSDSGSRTFSVTLNTAGAASVTVTDSQNDGTSITTSTPINALQYPTVKAASSIGQLSVSQSLTLSFTLVNPNNSPLSGVSFALSDTNGLVVASAPGISNNCGSGNISANPGNASVVIAGVNLTAGKNCSISVLMRASANGQVTLMPTLMSTDQLGAGPDGDPVQLTVVPASPAIAITFGPNVIFLNNVSTLTYALTNPGPSDLSGILLTHPLPANMVIAAAPATTDTCSTSGTINATPGSNQFRVSGLGMLGDESCTLTVAVTTNLSTGVFTTYVTGLTSAQTPNPGPDSANATLTVTTGKVDTIGIYRPSEQKFYLKNQNTTGPADQTVIVGGLAPNANYLPVAGDWNGDGIDTVGVYNTGTGVFQLTDSNVTGAINYTFTLGDPGDTPFSGHWTGDMTHDGAGVYRPSNGILYLRKALSTGISDFYAVMGNPGDSGLAGDWDGDGIDTVGVYRPADSRFYLSNATPQGITFADFAQLLGNGPTDDPVIGDWIGQGHSGVGVFRRNNGIVYLKYGFTGIYADVNFIYGVASDKPLAGHWSAASTTQAGAPRIVVQPTVPPTTPAANTNGSQGGFE